MYFVFHVGKKYLDMIYLLCKNLSFDNNKFFSSLFNPIIHVNVATLITETKQINTEVINISLLTFIFKHIGKMRDNRNTIIVGKITFLHIH